MEKKRVAIIGIGGRTGTMLANELQNHADVFGVGREVEVNLIEEKRLYVGDSISPYEGKVITNTEFKEDLWPDLIFLATKNPVSAAIKYYLEKFKKGYFPALILSQNGISTTLEAKTSLERVLSYESDKVRIIRMVIFNPVEKKQLENKIHIKYSLPIQIAIAKVSGESDIKDVIDILKLAKFRVTEFEPNQAQNLEYSKLFLNLVGMASASRGLSVANGLERPEVFKEEINSLKEYVRVVNAYGGKFLNFPNYPVGLFSFLISVVPTMILQFFKSSIISMITSKREEKPKDLDEIDYYNGAVVKLGHKAKIKVEVNKKIYDRALERLKS
jgi:ketopantoate reductase